MPYNPTELEPRWQSFWEEQETFVAKEDFHKKKFYALDMFPYPSGKGLHVGHPAGYTASDVVCRFKRALGFNVLHPMGFDAFGLPAEQKAIDEGIAPQLSTEDAIVNFRRQLKRLGFSYDWSREISTCDPQYYKWTQNIFVSLYQRGLAYQSDVFVNWCPALGTVLANDEVIDGKSERGGHPVERKRMKQWMLRITDFAERFLDGLNKIDWPEDTKTRQRDWIGKSFGAYVDFKITDSPHSLKIFTTRPDTLWGVTYMVLSPEHPLVESITHESERTSVEAYRRDAAGRSDVERQKSKVKSGVFTGAMAINPVNGEAIPIWISDYVLMGYGTGAIMAVPAHDSRDHEFAVAMKLPIREVIRPQGASESNVLDAAYEGEGVMVNSAQFDGTSTADGHAVLSVIRFLEEKSVGQGTTMYKLRDWVFARQRYWGEPIPLLKDEAGNVVRALSESELPVTLPHVQDYRPTGTGESPLATAKDWLVVEDNVSGRPLIRETDTMPGSAGSSWYFLRFCDPHNTQSLCDRAKSDYWMPVDLYVGGKEHSVGHLLYARMWQKHLFDLGMVRDDEPFQKLRHQGMILGFTYFEPDKKTRVHNNLVEERQGKFFKRGTDIELTVRTDKMSKRYGNVVNPDDIVQSYGADALRVYICFMGPLDADKPWQTEGLEGQYNWLKRAWRLFFEGDSDMTRVQDVDATDAEKKIIHKAIKKVTCDIDSLDLNTAISALHIATRDLLQLGTRSRSVLEPLAQLIAPFAPHFADEVWHKALGHSNGISFVPWPQHDEQWTREDTITIGVQINGKTHGTIELPLKANEQFAMETAQKSASISKQLSGKSIQKIIYKEGKILNIIVAK